MEMKKEMKKNRNVKKYNEIQLGNNKMDLNNRKLKNHPPSPVNNPLFIFP